MAFSIHIKDTILDLSKPVVMGILNTTPDSFFDGGRYRDVDAALKQAEQMQTEGAGILDIGGYSSRPGAQDVSVQEELDRVVPLIEAISTRMDVTLSVDTFRAEVAQAAVQVGAHMVNDISAGDDDPAMIPAVAQLGVPYFYMHKQGVPQTMQKNPHYTDVVSEVLEYLRTKRDALLRAGISQLIADPGFGFGKTVAHNYALLAQLDRLKELDLPILVGVSRKSMVTRVLDVDQEQALNGTSVLHAFCLERGANILRVHDVAEARQAIMLWECLRENR